MEHTNSDGTSTLRTWVKAIVIWGFLGVWLTGMTAGITAGGCRKDRYQAEKKLRFCNVSLCAGMMVEVFATERAKRSGLHLERGIALVQIGRETDAMAAFETAIKNARAREGHWEGTLHQHVRELNDQNILGLWVSAVEKSAQTSAPKTKDRA